LNTDPRIEDMTGAWAAADSGKPLPTEDQGDFRPLDLYETDWSNATIWHETAPDGSLEEVWEKISDGGGKFLAARRGNAILTIADKYFAFAEDDAQKITYLFGNIQGT
jgi:hypothetical protein